MKQTIRIRRGRGGWIFIKDPDLYWKVRDLHGPWFSHELDDKINYRFGQMHGHQKIIDRTGSNKILKTRITGRRVGISYIPDNERPPLIR
jgi:hypothetical protein